MGRRTGLLFYNCLKLNQDKSNFLIYLHNCLKRRSLLWLDQLLDDDVIDLSNGLQLIRKDNHTDRRFSMKNWRVVDNLRMEDADWKTEVLHRIVNVLDTHVLRISYRNGNEPAIEEGRRRRRNAFMNIIMFGMMAVVMIMVPMGFQFLAVLGGKALLLAKMALILTSIQGLKKIATSNFNYGLYAAPNPGHWNRQYESENMDNYHLDDNSIDFLHPRTDDDITRYTTLEEHPI